MNFLSCPEAYITKPPRPQKLHKVIDRLPSNSAAVATDQRPQLDAATRPAFDAEAALARAEGDRDLLRSMVGLFGLQWSKLGAEIAKAGQHRNGAVLELTAHKLERSLASFGAVEASRLAEQLEARGRKGDYHDLEKSCAGLKMEIERLVNALKEFTSEMVPCAS